MIKLGQVVQRDPDILNGTAVFVGTRVPIRSLFDYLEGGDPLDEFFCVNSRWCAASRLSRCSVSRAKPSRPMRLLLDQPLPIDLISELHGHAVDTVVWAGIRSRRVSCCAE